MLSAVPILDLIDNLAYPYALGDALYVTRVGARKAGLTSVSRITVFM